MVSHYNNKRAEVLGYAVLLVIAALIIRMCYLQVVQGNYYSTLAEGNRIRIIPIMASRGDILDRNGLPLVSTRPGFSVSILPLTTQIPSAVIERLSQILVMMPEEITKKLAQKTGVKPICIKSDIGPDILAKIKEQQNELPAIDVQVQPVRIYYYNELAAHVLGYTGEISDVELENMKKPNYEILEIKKLRKLGYNDIFIEKLKEKRYKSGCIIGKGGLEKTFDSILRGIDGGFQVEVDVAGRPIQVLTRKEPIQGYNLVLTIDNRIQKAAEEAIDEQLKSIRKYYGNVKAAAAVAMNPKTGEILALVSRPVYNPNWFVGGISTKNWNQLNNNPDNPMTNKAVAGEYPPGSIFKIITGVAALEYGKVTPEEKILDNGLHSRVKKGNAEGEALGWISFKEALAKSDNVYFYEMGLRLGIDNLEKYAREFGLGALTGIKLAEETEGLVASRAYKKKNYNEEWYEAETADAAIGQGFQLATPLQVAVMISQIANGGLRYQPYLVSRVTNSNGEVIKEFGPKQIAKLPTSDRTLKLVQEALKEVMLDGTATELFRGFPISIAGKTGTAENSGRDHGWFVGYGPYYDPNIVVTVIVEHGGFGVSAAGPIAKKILEAAFNLERRQPEQINPANKPH